MGNNLAKEVKAFVKDWCPGEKGPRLGRLSFVCHSNGGLVARSALPRLIEDPLIASATSVNGTCA